MDLVKFLKYYTIHCGEFWKNSCGKMSISHETLRITQKDYKHTHTHTHTSRWCLD